MFVDVFHRGLEMDRCVGWGRVGLQGVGWGEVGWGGAGVASVACLLISNPHEGGGEQQGVPAYLGVWTGELSATLVGVAAVCEREDLSWPSPSTSCRARRVQAGGPASRGSLPSATAACRWYPQRAPTLGWPPLPPPPALALPGSQGGHACLPAVDGATRGPARAAEADDPPPGVCTHGAEPAAHPQMGWATRVGGWGSGVADGGLARGKGGSGRSATLVRVLPGGAGEVRLVPGGAGEAVPGPSLCWWHGPWHAARCPSHLCLPACLPCWGGALRSTRLQ